MNDRSPQKMNRRKFLKLAGATLGVSTATCCGLGTLATYQPKIDFVENLKLFYIVGPNFFKNLVNMKNSIISVFSAGISHMQQQVCFASFLQCGFESSYKFMRQMAYKTDCIRQYDCRFVGKQAFS